MGNVDYAKERTLEEIDGTAWELLTVIFSFSNELARNNHHTSELIFTIRLQVIYGASFPHLEMSKVYLFVNLNQMQIMTKLKAGQNQTI